MLTKGDDYPLHQTPEPVAYVGAARNFYDRFFFNGYNQDGSVFFAAAMGIYPYVNILDGAFSVVIDGIQHNVYGSKVMHMERLDTFVGPVAIDIVEPFRVSHLRCDDAENGIKADLVFTSRCEAHEEPRFTRRQGSQLAMDVTRMMQNGTWSGWIEVKGKRIEITPEAFCGTRDRSWGVRGIGAPDAQPNPNPAPSQYYWLWAPLNFDDCVAHYFLNDDAAGEAWNTNGIVMPLLGEGDEETMASASKDIEYQPGTRFARTFDIHFTHKDGDETHIELEPQFNWYMKGVGYGHPEWAHGTYHGELATGYDEFKTDEVTPDNVHIQAFCHAKMTTKDGVKEGRGVLEQLIIGPHAPSGFTEFMDFAPL
jgi:hypothetical protein